MAGAPLLTPAIVLGALRYGETSRIVRLLTSDLGMVSAIAKGAMRPRSRFGASLQLLSEGHAHLILSRSSELHTLAAFDVAASHGALAANLDRFAAATALAEVAARFVPPTANEALYDQVRADLLLIERVGVDAVGIVAIRAIWRLVTALGFGPTVDRCARDGTALPAGPVAFSLRDGGFLCTACARLGATTRLVAGDRADLTAFLGEGDLPWLTPRQAAAHRRLAWRWVREHLSDGALPALEAWSGASSSPVANGSRTGGSASD
jgi:DNA repair protein RecO (recombination protein O)